MLKLLLLLIFILNVVFIQCININIGKDVISKTEETYACVTMDLVILSYY